MPDHEPAKPSQLAITTLAGGCFWCLEAVFEEIAGVESVTSGYMGGHTDHPGYRAVCAGETGHAEVVQLQFNPNIVGFRDLLDVFFTIHDPTTLNRQGNDVGTQYRSVIFFHTPQQEVEARAAIARLDEAKPWPDPIVTAVVPAEVFWPAEDYHRSYFRNNAWQPYCQVVVAPKVAKARQRFLSRLKR